jgi:serine-type D-Ala-D-Ala carboxypeptidase
MASSATCRYPETTALLKQAVRDRVFPGCTFAVLAPGENVPAEGAAQAVGHFTYEPDSPRVELSTSFDLASLTKVLATTMAVMQLYERGKLALDTPVPEWLPEFAAANSADKRRARVTVRMLLDHSSGLPGYARLFESARTRTEIIAAAVNQPLIADPGMRTEYSDIGFIILGHLVEMITNEWLDTYCRREIFEPLRMRTSGYRPGPELRASIPPTENDRTFRRRIIQGEVHDENASVMDGVAGHAGLFSIALDPLRVAACMLNGGITSSAVQLFSPQTIALFATRSTQPCGTSRALGWDTPSVPSSAGRLFSQRSIGHLGYTGTSLWIDLDAGVAVILLTNRTWPDRASQAIRELRPRFHDTLRHELVADHKK